MTGEFRTSRLTILGRFAGGGLLFGLLCYSIDLFFGLGDPTWPFLIGGMAGFLVLPLAGMIVGRLAGAISYGDDPDYREFRRTGGDPYLDYLPPPFNFDSHSQRMGGIREPETNFVPPSHWRWQCLRCGARKAGEGDKCWNCGLGYD